MKKPTRRRRFFALDERTPAAYFQDQRDKPGARRPLEEDPAEEEDLEDEESEEAASDLAEPQNAVDPAEEGDLPPGFTLSRAPRVRAPKKRRVSLGKVGWIAAACLVLGGLTGYLLAKIGTNGERPPAPTATEKVQPLTAAEQEQLDAAYEARYQRHYGEAEQQFTTLSKAHPEWKWLELERNRTLLFAGKVIDARLALMQEAEKSAQPAEANYLLATAYMVERAYPRAESLYAAAVAHDPTRPEYYYLWGDCLRVDGKPLEAAGKFRAALFRNTFEIATPFYQLKWWLCQIDADQEDANGLNAELDAALAGPRPSMPVLFAAAARAAKKGDFKMTGEYLRQARVVTDPTMFTILLHDPAFGQAITRSELADLFQAGKGAVPPVPAEEAKPTTPVAPAPMKAP